MRPCGDWELRIELIVFVNTWFPAFLPLRASHRHRIDFCRCTLLNSETPSSHPGCAEWAEKNH